MHFKFQVINSWCEICSYNSQSKNLSIWYAQYFESNNLNEFYINIKKSINAQNRNEDETVSYIVKLCS